MRSEGNLFTCWLPDKTGPLAMFILRRIFSGIRLNAELNEVIEKLPDDAVIVYTSKTKSYFEFLCYYTRYMAARLPYPRLGFDCHVVIFQPLGRLLRIAFSQLHYFFGHLRFRDPYEAGFIQDEIRKGTTAFLPLMEKADFHRQFIKSKMDPISHLIDLQRTMTRPIFIVPKLIFFSKLPESSRPSLLDIFFGSHQQPGRLRRLWTLFNKPKTIFIEVSDPIDLKRYVTSEKNVDRSTNYLTSELRRKLLRQINAHRKSITGPTIKRPEEIKQELLTGEGLRQFMVTYAKRKGIGIFDTHREAMGYVDEIAAKYSPSFIDITHRILRYFLNTLFESVTFNADQVSEIKRSARKGPIIFMPAHKSHMDSLLLLYTLYDNHMPCPLTFAGKNLAFWPMGPLFRRGGAFFVRRSFKGAVFYAKVFSAYIHKVLKEGFNIAVYIEGTRSRSGKLLKPQLGMLSILLQAFFSGACQDLIFVPVFIAYDRIPDEGAYLHEISGGKKSPESFRQMLKAKAIFQNRYGSVHIHFGHPFSLMDIMNGQGTADVQISSKQQNTLCRQIGVRVMNTIDRNAVVTPQSLVAGALLVGGKEVISRTEIGFRIEASTNLLFAQNTCLSEPLSGNYAYSVENTLHYYQRRKFIQRAISKTTGQMGADGFRIIESRRNALDYYKNTCICHFVAPAFTAVAILEKDAFQFSASNLHEPYRHLQNLFCEEFTPDAIQPPAFIVRKTVKAFIDNAILVPHPILPDTYNLSSEGLRKLIFFAGYIEPLLESYRTALVYFSKNRRNQHHKPRILKKMLSIGNRMLRQGEIRLKESVSKANYDNAVTFFSKNGVRGSEDEERIWTWNNAITRYLNLLSR